MSRLATSAGRHCVVAGLAGLEARALFSIWGPWFSGVLLHSLPASGKEL